MQTQTFMRKKTSYFDGEHTQGSCLFVLWHWNQKNVSKVSKGEPFATTVRPGKIVPG